MASLLGIGKNSFINPTDKDEELRRGAARVVAAQANQSEDPNAQPQPTGSVQTTAPTANIVTASSTPTLAAEKWGQYQWRPDFQTRAGQLFNQEVVAAQQHQDALRGLRENYNAQVTEANSLQELARKRLGNQFGANNSAFSGRRVAASTELGNNWQKYMDQLSRNQGANETNALNAYWNQVNNIRNQADILFDDQARVEEAERVERERQAAEAAAAEQARIQMQQMIDAQNALANQPPPQIYIQPPSFSPPSGGGVRGGGGDEGGGWSPPAAAPFAPNWNIGPAPWEDIMAYAKQFWPQDAKGRSVPGTARAGSMESILRSLQTDADFSGMMQNSMGHYFGGANSYEDVARWILNPRLNEQRQREYMGFY